MAMEDAERVELRRRLEEVLGEKYAGALMRDMDPDRVASKADMTALSGRVDDLSQAMEQMEQRFDLKLEATEHRIVGTLHRELGILRTEMANQTRMYMFAMLGALVTLAGFGFVDRL